MILWGKNMDMNDVANKKLIKEKEYMILDIVQNLERWEEIKDHGCHDPFYSDGVNMNLVRNHIIYDKRRLMEICETLNEPLPEEYYLLTPPKVHKNYLCKNGEHFEERKKRIQQWKNGSVIVKISKIKDNRQTELF